MDPDKVLRVVGMSSIVPFDKDDPFNPINRRISIVVLNRATEEAFLADGQSVNVEDVAGARGAVTPP
jgi:chemotaxis protein MotB